MAKAARRFTFYKKIVEVEVEVGALQIAPRIDRFAAYENTNTYLVIVIVLISNINILANTNTNANTNRATSYS